MYSEGYQPGNITEHLGRMEVSGGTNDFERVVWAPDPKEGYVLGDLTDIGANCLTVERKDGQGKILAKHSDVFPSEDDNEKTVDDNCGLMYLNEGTLLNNCRKRYENNQIYSYVANILISINPYEQMSELYSIGTIKSYNGKSLGQMPPHIYAIADKAYRDMRRSGESQSVIVSGESGAGKTESQKAILKYLCENWGTEAGPIQQRLLETNPILEAFGNAKTMRNNNSSRFGKFVEIHFGPNHQVAGGYISHYLLEKSRLCSQSEGERNYHIFYQLIAGCPQEMYNKLKLASPDKFNYLRRGSTQFFCKAGNEGEVPAGRVANTSFLHDPMVDDAADFRRLIHCFQECGMNNSQMEQVFKVVASLLHLGNISFVDNVDDSRGGCKVDPASQFALSISSELLGLEEQELKMCLTSRAMQPTKGGVKGTLILVPLKVHEAGAARDALAKAIYSKLFDWIVASINKSIPFSNSANYIGVLDIAGFEFFGVNSFEQFCINYCNEKLQHFFNERILKQEQDLYEKEGLGVDKIEYTDNQDCIDLFEKKPCGMLDILDEEMRLPRPTSQHFTSQVHSTHQKHFRLDTPRKSKIKEHRDMRDDDGLLVRHYAGTVCYQTAQFLEKNNDALHASLEAMIQGSSIDLLRTIFESSAPAPEATPTRGKPMGKLVAASVGNKFRSQLGLLLEKLQKTGTHFVRCVKPNSGMTAWKFDGSMILSQLKCAGMGSVLRLMQKGYPSRTLFSELYNQYAPLLPPELVRLDPRLFCKCLFRVLGLNSRDFKFGMTKVFFRPGKFAEFDQLLRQDPDNMRLLVKKVKAWLVGVRWRKAAYGAWSVIKLKKKIEYRAHKIRTIQKNVRGYLVRKTFKPRLAIYRKTMALHIRSGEMQSLVEQLSPSGRSMWESEVVETQKSLAHLVRQCKVAYTGMNQEMEIESAARNYEECLRRVDKIIAGLRSQMENDEVIRLAEIERKMREQAERETRECMERADAEKQRKEHEKMRRQIEEDRKRAEAEHQRKMVEEKERERMEREEEEKRRVRDEQDRLDVSLSSRLATESGSGLHMDNQPPSTSMSSSGNNNSGTSKYDLSSWKYAELRDTINTSSDMELLLACKEEFHRRLRIYNEWKSRNASAKEGGGADSQKRMPLALMNSGGGGGTTTGASRSTAPQVNPALCAQRFFKVPFTRKSQQNKNPSGFVMEAGGQNGVWYGHFNGQWIQRQIELHPDKTPLLLVAGRDDMQMCELPLDQTELPRKKGAEILEHEFETVWQHLGGKPLPRWNP